jgi:hypothetical protein
MVSALSGISLRLLPSQHRERRAIRLLRMYAPLGRMYGRDHGAHPPLQKCRRCGQDRSTSEVMAYRTAIVAHDAVTDSMIGEMKVAPLVIMTPRLRLRQFRSEDAEPSAR